MGKEHMHSHNHEVTSINKAFIIGILLNIAFVVVEFGTGLYYDSLALISDAGHNLSDVVSLILALLAFRLSRIKANSNYTYGYKRSTVLVSLLNAVILLVAVGAILMESINKLQHPQEVPGSAIAWVAGIGVVINTFTALLFLKNKERDLNIKGAYLHMMADALVSIGVLVAGLVIQSTEWYVIDPIIGIVVAILILGSTWGLLKESLKLSLDGVPNNIKLETVKERIQQTPHVIGAHHLHIRAISTTENALTVHIIIDDMGKMEETKQLLRNELEKENIQHVTLEFEHQSDKCSETCELFTR